jgi:hypothetical protein
MTFFDIVLQTTASLHADGEPDGLISEFTGYVRAEGEDDVLRRVGKVHAWRINAELAAASGEPLFDVCDAHSHEMHVVHTLLYEPDEYHFRDEITDRFGDAGWDCLVLDYVVLHPRWRGLKLGLLAVRKMVDLLGGGCGLAVCNVAPLRHDAHALLRVPRAWLPRHETPAARREAARRLRRYYRRMGFERIGRTGCYGLSMAREAPTLADLLRPSS